MDDWILWLVLGAFFGVFALRFFWQRLKLAERRAVARRAKEGENKAVKLLQEHGYRILAEQERRNVSLIVNGERIESFIKADFIVSKRGYTYLVEVKTGAQANVRLPNVRRQLFEYQNIFQTDGILFIDMNKYDIMTVSFENSKSNSPSLRIFLLGILGGILLMVFIYSYY